MTTTLTEGPWMQAPNMSKDAVGSIHDDEQARKLGFRAALIGGSVLSAFMTPALVERYGKDWYERGFLKLSFIRPIYETDAFRIVFDEQMPASGDQRLDRLSLEKNDGERAVLGYAGLARSAADAVPVWQRAGEPPAATPAAAEHDPLPAEPIGTARPPRVITVTPEQSANRRAAAADGSPWYMEHSPWGGPIVPTFMYFLINMGNGTPRAGDPAAGAARAGMNGTFQLLLTGPMFARQPYTLRSQLAEKGFSGRTAFRTAEYTLADANERVVATVRQKVKWFAG